MRLFLRGAIVALSVSLLSAAAFGMRFDPVALSPDEVILDASQTIVAGDTDRLTAAVAAVRRNGRRIVALSLNSGGGAIVEAAQMAAVVKSLGLTVVIPEDGVCASACFLLLAASPHRFAAPTARIGVHSASENGAETGVSLAMTTLMARAASELGVPPAIIGKLVATAPDRVEWLDASDLALLDVGILSGDQQTFLRGPVAPAQPATSADYTAGRADRRAWEIWLAALQGPYRQGAVFAQTHAQDDQPMSCYGPNNTHRGDFTLGCKVAQQKLGPVFGRIRSSVDYASGWNAVPATVQPPETVERVYQGVYFCGTQVAQVTLKIFAQPGSLRRQGIFVFGPHDNSPNIPSGSFTVGGVIEVNGGVLALSPDEWISRPPGYRWFGLNGRSDDGGKTFSGSLVDSASCTRFTLARKPLFNVSR